MTDAPRLTTPDDRATVEVEVYKKELARELLDDIELSKLAPDQLVLKASRLARLTGAADTREWLDCELLGYTDTEVARRWLHRSGRWINEEAETGYFAPLGQIQSALAANQAELSQLRVPDVSVSTSVNPTASQNRFDTPSFSWQSETPVDRVLARMQGLTTENTRLSGIIRRTVSLLHVFATQTYHRLAFGGVAESIFRDHQIAIDRLLIASAADVLEKIPSITARLAEGDTEAISQAMNSCRRMVKALADAKQPGENREVGDGDRYSIATDKVLNRIKYYLSQHCTSESRRDRLNRNLRAIWERTAAGAHSDISSEEARALFLQTYLTLGETLDALLARDPAARPDVTVIRVALGLVPAGGVLARTIRSDRESERLLGRDREGDALGAAFAETLAGRAITMFVSGESGVGKSALCGTFITELCRQGQAVVLRGRCHEREHVPFKGIDSLIDDLSRHLRRLPPADVAALMPREIFALERVFPVLGRVEAVERAPRKHILDPQELRQRAFSAFYELAARMRDRCPLVLFIDDAQWLDRDASLFLASFFLHHEPVPLLLLLSYRSHEAAANPELMHLQQQLSANQRWERRDVPLGPLPIEAARELAATLLGSAHSAAAEEIACEANGSPFFVRALTRYLLLSEGRKRPTMQQAVLAQVDALEARTQHLLRVVAGAGWAIPISVALDAAGANHSHIDALRDESLVRTGEGGKELSLICYHDAIRETLVASLSDEQVQAIHRRLLRVLESSQAADPQHLAQHAYAARDLAAAARYSVQAAERASELLAFDQAARSYTQALECGGHATSQRAALWLRLGEVLTNAGRGAQAAHAYLEAAKLSEHHDAIDMKRRASEQLLISGHIDEGKTLLAQVLAAIDLQLPSSLSSALRQLGIERLRLSLRGLAFHPSEEPLPVARQRELDVLLSAVRGLSLVDIFSGAALSTRCMRLALDSGIANRAAWAFASEAWFVAAAGRTKPSRTDRADELLARADQLAAVSGDPENIARTLLLRGMVAVTRGDQRACKTFCDRAVDVFCERCTAGAIELAVARQASLIAAFDLGEFVPAAEIAALIDEAWRRDHLFAAISYTGFGVVSRLIQGDEEGVNRHMLEARSRWLRPCSFSWPDWFLLFAETWLDVYAGKPSQSLDRLQAEWPAIERAGFLRGPAGVDLHFYRGASSLATARIKLAQTKSLHALAKRSARVLLTGRALGVPYGHALSAWLALEQSRTDIAVHHLQKAHVAFEAAGIHIYALLTRRQLGHLLVGDAGKFFLGQAEAKARTMDVPDVTSMLRLLTFGLEWPALSVHGRSEC